MHVYAYIVKCVVVYTLYNKSTMWNSSQMLSVHFLTKGFLFGRGLLVVGSWAESSSLPSFRVMPVTERTAAEEATNRELNWWPKMKVLGLSLKPPRPRGLLKYSSKGSWLNFSVRRYSTPSSDNKIGASSTKESTIWEEKQKGHKHDIWLFKWFDTLCRVSIFHQWGLGRFLYQKLGCIFLLQI